MLHCISGSRSKNNSCCNIYIRSSLV